MNGTKETTMKTPTAIGGTVIHSEGATEDATAIDQMYVNVVQHADGALTVEMQSAGPNRRHPVIRSWFTVGANDAAITEARGIASGIRADARWMAR